MTLQEAKRIHMIGVGGIGMSALARLLLHEGKMVSGTDRSPSIVTEGLEKEGVAFSIAQTAESIPADVEFVVYSDAIYPDHPERQEVARRGVSSLNYADALGTIANEYYVIVVTGTHGKTTTTAMTIDVLEAAGLDPTAVVGSLRSKTHSNFRTGKGKYFIVEGDEYRRHFLAFQPSALVITNIEPDHLDYYTDLADIESAFHELAMRVPQDGVIVADTSIPSVKRVLEGVSAKIVDYRTYIDLTLPMKAIGLHNYKNAGAVLALADFLAVEKVAAEKALSEFAGTWRRFECLGTASSGALVYDDYGHHPTEVRVTLKAAREKFPDKKIIVAFHPHLYSRTTQLFDDFVTAFKGVDGVVIAPIFAAREIDDGTISNHILADAITKSGTKAIALDSFDAIATYLGEHSDQNTLVITMGAGDIYKVAEKLTKKQK